MGEGTGTVGAGESRTEALLGRVVEEEGRPALIAYLPLGCPDVPRSVEALKVLADSGVDIIELGIPHTEPVMDGEVNQRASQVALDAGTRVAHLFDAVREIRDYAPHVEVLVMTYWDPIVRYGVDRFARALSEAGGAGMITPDLSLDQADDWMTASDKHGLDRVFFVKPSASSQPEALAGAALLSRGFVYAASIMGVTGARDTVGERAEELVKNTRAAGASKVCVGLGVSSGDQAAEVGRWADGVIVGSVLVSTLLTAEPWQDRLKSLAAVTRELADGVRRARPSSETGTPHDSAPDRTRRPLMSSTLSLPGFDEQIRNELDERIRAGKISDPEVDTLLWLLQENPGRYESYDELYEVVRSATPTD
jgi:tryptophan synthase alpha chain